MQASGNTADRKEVVCDMGLFGSLLVGKERPRIRLSLSSKGTLY